MLLLNTEHVSFSMISTKGTRDSVQATCLDIRPLLKLHDIAKEHLPVVYYIHSTALKYLT